jgi:hypothetical protein
LGLIDYTNSGMLIPSIKNRIVVPTSQQTFTPSKLMQIAYEEMKNEIFPMLINLQSSFFKYPYDYDLTDSEFEIELPPSAIGMKLNNVVVLSNQNSNQVCETPMTQLENRPAYGWWVYNGFWMQDNKVVIYSQNPQTVRLYVYKRPNKLVVNDEGAQITSLDANTQTVMCATVPTTWADATDVCCVTAYPGFRLIFDSSPISNLSGNTFDLADVSVADFAKISVGDWICLENESTIAQIPVEAQPILAQATAVKLLEGMGDRQGLAVSQAKLGDIINKFTAMNAPRVDDSPKKINNLNTYMWNNPFNSMFPRRW